MVDNQIYLLCKPIIHLLNTNVINHKQLNSFHILKQGWVLLFGFFFKGVFDSLCNLSKIEEKNLHKVILYELIAHGSGGVSLARPYVSPKVQSPTFGGIFFPVCAICFT